MYNFIILASFPKTSAARIDLKRGSSNWGTSISWNIPRPLCTVILQKPRVKNRAWRGFFSFQDTSSVQNSLYKNRRPLLSIPNLTTVCASRTGLSSPVATSPMWVFSTWNVAGQHPGLLFVSNATGFQGLRTKKQEECKVSHFLFFILTVEMIHLTLEQHGGQRHRPPCTMPSQIQVYPFTP